MYKDFDDQEIITMIRESDDYLELMLKKYEPIIKSISHKYIGIAKKVGLEWDDLIQIANIALVNACNNYNNYKNVLFYTYVTNCIKNSIITEIKSQDNNKRKIMNSYISYYELINETNECLLDIIINPNAINPLDEVLKNELVASYIRFINTLPFEVALVFDLKNSGFTIDEIKKISNLDHQTILKYNRYARSKLCLN